MDAQRRTTGAPSAQKRDLPGTPLMGAPLVGAITTHPPPPWDPHCLIIAPCPMVAYRRYKDLGWQWLRGAIEASPATAADHPGPEYPRCTAPQSPPWANANYTVGCQMDPHRLSRARMPTLWSLSRLTPKTGNLLPMPGDPRRPRGVNSLNTTAKGKRGVEPRVQRVGWNLEGTATAGPHFLKCG